MKLNNKGFAISTIVYGLLMMAILVIVILLSTMSFTKKTSDDLSAQVEERLNSYADTCANNPEC